MAKAPRPAAAVARIGIIAALAYALSLAALPIGGSGGSLSLAMVPLIVLARLRGPAEGGAAGLLLGSLKLLTTGKVFGLLQALLDYPVAYGLAGALGGTLTPADGTLVACLGRFAVHVLTGMIYFEVPALGSFLYNATYMAPETLFTVAAVVHLDRTGNLRRLARLSTARGE